jgi:apolipoprotein D and lipocalin family protein
MILNKASELARTVRGLAASGLLVAFTLLGCASDPPLEVAPSVNLSQLQGKWYEIARLPRTTEVDCHGTTAFYTQAPDGSLSLVNQCNVGSASGTLQTISMTATVPDSAVPAKLALNVGGYTGDYWILEVGPNYEYAVVGHPSRLYLWILSRTPTLDSSVMSGVLSRAESEHFDTSQLEYTPQPPAGERNTLDVPQGTVPAGPHAGCALALATRRPARDYWLWCSGVSLAVLVLRRRRIALNLRCSCAGNGAEPTRLIRRRAKLLSSAPTRTRH